MLLEAIRFAGQAHKNQRRKYTGRPYIEHPVRVMSAVIFYDRPDWTEKDRLLAAKVAVLHDTIEDSSVTAEQVASKFGFDVCSLVEQLTNQFTRLSFPGMPRHQRKRKECDRLSGVSKIAKIVKLFDRIDNLDELSRAEEWFRKSYAQESRQLAMAIGDVDRELKRQVLYLTSRLVYD